MAITVLLIYCNETVEPFEGKEGILLGSGDIVEDDDPQYIFLEK